MTWLASTLNSAHNSRAMNPLPFSYRLDWRFLPLAGAATFFPTGLALLLALLIPSEPSVTAEPLFRSVSFETARQLEGLFDKADFSWPPRRHIPPIGITRLPADMAELDIQRKKALFLCALLPLVVSENTRLLDERRWLEHVINNGGPYLLKTRYRLQRLAGEYGLSGIKDPDVLLATLYERVDIVPVGLVLAQAANESGWGTSRFSREANNLFGEWTYKADEGIVPRRRPKGARHYVRRFNDLRSSVRSYLNNINRSKAYASLRRLRAEMRAKGQEPDALILASKLEHYSAHGKRYVSAIQSLIRSNKLHHLELQALAAALRRGQLP